MENWIVTVFKINPELEILARCAEKRALEKAKRPSFNTQEDVMEVLNLVNEKNAYFNLRVIFNSFKDALSKNEFDMLSLYAKGVGVSDIARSVNAQRTTVYRILKKALTKCELSLKSLDYNTDSLEKEFLWLPLVANIMNAKAA